jgi:hypothetical protein
MDECKADMLAWAVRWMRASPEHVRCKLTSPAPVAWWTGDRRQHWGHPGVPDLAREVASEVALYEAIDNWMPVPRPCFVPEE